MTLLLAAITVLLLLILIVISRNNALRELQWQALQMQREHDIYFSLKNRPHWEDKSRIELWASERGWTVEKAYEWMRETELNENISRSLQSKQLNDYV